MDISLQVGDYVTINPNSVFYNFETFEDLTNQSLRIENIFNNHPKTIYVVTNNSGNKGFYGNIEDIVFDWREDTVKSYNDEYI